MNVFFKPHAKERNRQINSVILEAKSNEINKNIFIKIQRIKLEILSRKLELKFPKYEESEF